MREAGRRTAKAERRARAAEYIAAYYERLFPWLTEFRNEEIEELLVVAPSAEETLEAPEDPAKRWLTDAEFKRLPTAKKYGSTS